MQIDIWVIALKFLQVGREEVVGDQAGRGNAQVATLQGLAADDLTFYVADFVPKLADVGQQSLTCICQANAASLPDIEGLANFFRDFMQAFRDRGLSAMQAGGDFTDAAGFGEQ